MGGTVVIKWGGGLITHKDQLCTVNQTVIDLLAKVCSQSGKKLVIVHGAGSFGHMKAKKYRLSEGRIEGLEQDDAVEEVRSDMIKLNQSVVNSLQSHGLSVKSYPPHKWARGTGPDFSGELPVHDHVTVVYGDVVDDDDSEFGILSGDDIMLRYATELPDVERAVFPLIISMYSSSETTSLSSNSISSCCPSLHFRTIRPILFTKNGNNSGSIPSATAIASKAIANIASPALIAVGKS